MAGAVWVLLGHYALNPDVTNVWPGVAGLFQVRKLEDAFILSGDFPMHNSVTLHA